MTRQDFSQRLQDVLQLHGMRIEEITPLIAERAWEIMGWKKPPQQVDASLSWLEENLNRRELIPSFKAAARQALDRPTVDCDRCGGARYVPKLKTAKDMLWRVVTPCGCTGMPTALEPHYLQWFYERRKGGETYITWFDRDIRWIADQYPLELKRHGDVLWDIELADAVANDDPDIRLPEISMWRPHNLREAPLPLKCAQVEAAVVCAQESDPWDDWGDGLPIGEARHG